MSDSLRFIELATAETFIACVEDLAGLAPLRGLAGLPAAEGWDWGHGAGGLRIRANSEERGNTG